MSQEMKISDEERQAKIAKMKGRFHPEPKNEGVELSYLHEIYTDLYETLKAEGVRHAEIVKR